MKINNQKLVDEVINQIKEDIREGYTDSTDGFLHHVLKIDSSALIEFLPEEMGDKYK